jgi:hypothetical protein
LVYLNNISLLCLSVPIEQIRWRIGKAPSSKLQAPEKLQIPSTKNEHLETCEAANTNKGGGTGFPRRFWALEFGIFLELGAWSLELLASLSPTGNVEELKTQPACDRLHGCDHVRDVLVQRQSRHACELSVNSSIE